MNTKDNHLATLEDALSASWQLMALGASDRRHGFHHPVVSTLGAGGTPESRIVILRGADAESMTVRFHTDVRSGKWLELGANPKTSICFYDETARTQVRISGSARLHNGDDIAADAWKASQRMSRVCYGISPGPGITIASADQFTLSEDEMIVAGGYANFGVVLVTVERLEWLYLQQAQNRRAVFDFTRDEKNWLVP
jgi:pyridoxamine 5'-phosphate oxidase